jgi:hypothetical protein
MYRAEGRIENALKCCKMKRMMKRLIEHGGVLPGEWGEEEINKSSDSRRGDDVATIADICEIALDHEEYKIYAEFTACGSDQVLLYPTACVLWNGILPGGGPVFQQSPGDTRSPLGSLSSTALNYIWNNGSFVDLKRKTGRSEISL